MRIPRRSEESRFVPAWEHLLDSFAAVFTAPSFTLFRQLMWAWVLCPGRHTITRLICTMEPGIRRSHDAYHRFFRLGRWSMVQMWRLLAKALVLAFYPGAALLMLDVDDTLFHKTGRKVAGLAPFGTPCVPPATGWYTPSALTWWCSPYG